MTDEDVLMKAELILADAIRVDDIASVPVRISNSTAGPGAGRGSVALSFKGMRIKKAIVTDGPGYSFSDGTIYQDGKPITEASIIPVVYHAPEQAFFNLDQRCMYHCRFCSSPNLTTPPKGRDPSDIVSLIESCISDVRAIAFTSGVHGSVQSTVDRMCTCVSAVHDRFPEIPIGVEPYVENIEQILSLKDAGASEMKINTECATEPLFSYWCPDLDYGNVRRMLAEAVTIFGKGKVASNVLIGLGETDEDVKDILTELAGIGVVPGLRPAKLKGGADLTPERILGLAKMHKRILSENGLTTETFETMCFRCTCCEIVPFSDL